MRHEVSKAEFDRFFDEMKAKGFEPKVYQYFKDLIPYHFHDVNGKRHETFYACIEIDTKTKERKYFIH